MGLPNIGPLELIIILAIALLIVGPGKLPEMGSAFGRTIREFRKASTDLGDATKVQPAPNTLPGQPQVQPNTLSAGVVPAASADAPGAAATEPATAADPVDDRA